MSIYYDLYLEGLVEDKWIALGPWFQGQEGGFYLGPVMTGQSYVGSMLRDLSYCSGTPSDVSPEVRDMLLFADCDPFFNEDENDPVEVESCLRLARWFPLSVLGNIDPARFEHEAYVPRNLVHAFERGDFEEIDDWISPEEYGGLPADEKKTYTYYRWTDPWGTYGAKVELKQRCNMIAGMFNDCKIDGEYRRPDALRILVRMG